ncbi:MAG: hypothetical protein HBSIN02_20930 [Bacteroidia bacterium]|nr:MAG: hypothetical protein HBSIN02_20930 [Bacteroidia bacterium]
MDDRFERGLERFNARDFFEAHEIWEDLWHEYRESDRTFLQGLIQLAAGLYHLDAGNTKGAASQLIKGTAKLRPYAPSHRGMDLNALLNDVSACLKILEGDDPASAVSPSIFPAIRSSD